MKAILKFTICSLCLFSPILTTKAQQTKSDPQLDSKIERYYKALRRSAKAGPLFDEFHNHWLAEHTDEELEKFLKQQAKSEEIADYQILAIYQIRLGQEILAIETLKEALQITPNKAAIYFTLAQLYGQTLDFEQALKYIIIAEDLAKDDVLSRKIGKAKGVILIRENRQEDALAHWKKLIERNPQDKELIEDIIDLQLGEALYDQAIKLSQTLIESTKDPYRKALYKINLAKVYDDVGKQAQAIELYTTTLGSTGQGSWLEREIIAKIKEIYLRDGNPKALLDFHETSIKEHPNRIALKKDYADTLASQEKVTEAEKIYRDIIKLTPDDKTQVENLIQILTLAQQTAKAKQWLEKLVEEDPANIDYLLQLADLYYGLDDKVGLKQTLAKHYQLSKKDESAQLSRARILSKYGLKIDAKAQLATSHQQFPKSVKTKLALIDASIADKTPELTKQLCQQAADLASGEEILQIANKLRQPQPGLTQHALELLKSKLDQHRTDIGYIEKLCQYTLETENATQAIPWATSLMDLAEKTSQIDRVLKLCLGVIRETRSELSMITKLANKAELNIPETCLLALLYEDLGQHQKSSDILSALVEKKNLIGTIQASRIYEQLHQFPLAITTLEQAIQLPNGKKAVYLKKLTTLYMRTENTDRALAIIQLWKTLSPNKKTVWMRQIEILQRADRSPEALKQLRRAIIKFPKETELLQDLAGLQQEMGDDSEMISTLWKIHQQTKLPAEQKATILVIIEAYREANDLQTLIELLEKRHRNNQKSVSITLALAEANLAGNDAEQSRSYLLAASRLKPEDLSIIHSIADLDAEQGNIERSKSILLKAVAIDKTNKSIKRLAQLYIDDRDMEQGFSILKKLERDDDPTTASQIASLLLTEQELDDAYRYLENSHDKFPQDWGILYQLIFLSHALDKFDSVTSYVEELMILKSQKIGQETNNESLIQLNFRNRSRLKRFHNAPENYNRALAHENNIQIIGKHLLPFIQTFSIKKDSRLKLIIPKPRSLAEAKSLALSQILHIENSKFKDNSEVWIKKNAKIKDLNYLRLSSKMVTYGKAPKDIKRLLANKENKLCSYLILVQTYGNILNAHQAEEASQLLRTEFPDISLRFRVSHQSDLSKEEQITLTKDVDASVFSRKDKINYLISLHQNKPEFRHLITTYLKKYQALILKQTSATAQNNLHQIDDILFNGLYQKKEIEKIIEKINYRSDFAVKNPQPLSPHLIKENISFIWPTTILESVPASVWNILYGGQYQPRSAFQRNNSIKANVNRVNLRFPAESIDRHLDKIKSIPLRIHLLAAVGKDAEAIELLRKSLKENPTSIDLRILEISHGFLKEKENRSQILKQIEATSVIPISRIKREQLDIILLNQVHHIAQDLKQFTVFKPTDFQQSALRRIVKQYRSSIRNIETFYSYLGMSEELEKKASAKTRIAKKRAIKRRNYYRRQTLAAHIVFESYVSSGRREIAVKYACRILRKYYAVNFYDYRHEIYQLHKRAEKSGLKEEIVKALLPAANGSLNQWTAYYKIMLGFNHPKQLDLARKHIINAKGIPLRKRIQVAMIIMPDASDRALDLLGSIPDDQNEYIAEAFYITYKQMTLGPRDFLNHLKGFSKYIEQQKIKFPITLEETQNENNYQIWKPELYFTNILSLIVGDRHFVGKSASYVPNYWNKTSPSPYSIQRDGVYDELVQSLHSYPACTDLAFRIMLLRDRNISETAKLGLVRKTLLSYNESTRVSHFLPQFKKRFTKTQTSYYFDNKPSAHHIALDYVMKKPDLAKRYFTSQLLEGLKERNPKIHSWLKNIQELARSKGKTLSDYIASYYEKGDWRKLRFVIHYSPDATEELSKQYLSHIQNISKSIAAYQAPEGEKRKTGDVINRKFIKSSERMHRFITEHLASTGNASQWVKSFKDLLTSDPVGLTHKIRYDKVPSSSRVHVELIFDMLSAARSPEYYVPLLDLAREYPGIVHKIGISSGSLGKSERVNYLKLLGLLVSSENIPFLQLSEKQRENWQTFVEINYPDDQKDYHRKMDSLVLEVFEAIGYDDRKMILKELSKIKDPDLQLSIAVFNSFLYYKKPDLIRIIEANGASLEKLNGNQRQAFITVLNLESVENTKILKSTKAAKILGMTNNKIHRLRNMEAEAFLELKVYEERYPYNLINKNSKLIESVIDIDPKLAAKIFHHSIKLCKNHPYYVKQAKQSQDEKNTVYHVVDEFDRIKIENWHAYFDYSIELMTHADSSEYQVFSHISRAEMSLPFINKKLISTTSIKEFLTYIDRYDGTDSQDFVDMILIFRLRNDKLKYKAILSHISKLDKNTRVKYSRIIKLLETMSRFYIKHSNMSKISRLVSPRNRMGLTIAYDHRSDTTYLAELLKAHQNTEHHLDFINTMASMTDAFSLQMPDALKSICEVQGNSLKILEYGSINRLFRTYPHRYKKLAHHITKNYLKKKTEIEYNETIEKNVLSYIMFVLSAANAEQQKALLNEVIHDSRLAKLPLIRFMCFKHGILSHEQFKIESVSKIRAHNVRHLLVYDRILEKVLIPYMENLNSNADKMTLLEFTSGLYDSADDLHQLKYRRDQRELMFSKLGAINASSLDDPKFKNRLYDLFGPVNLEVSKQYRALLDKEFSDALIMNFIEKSMYNKYEPVIKHYFALQFDSLNFKKSLKLIETIINHKKNTNSWGVTRLKAGISDGAFMVALDCIHHNNPAKLEKLLPILRKLVELRIQNWYVKKSSNHSYGALYIRDVLYCLNIAHSVCGKQSEYNEFINTWTSKKSQRYFAKNASSISDNFYTVRRPFMKFVFKHNPDMIISNISNYSIIRRILEKGSIPTDELLKMVNICTVKRVNLYKKQFHLAHIYETMGDEKSALTAWNKALELASIHSDKPSLIYKMQYEKIVALYHLQGIEQALLALEILKPVVAEEKKLHDYYLQQFLTLKNQLLYLKKNPIENYCF